MSSLRAPGPQPKIIKTHRIACCDTGTKCTAIFEGRNDDKIVLEAVTHLSQTHGVTLSPDLAASVRNLIKTA